MRCSLLFLRPLIVACVCVCSAHSASADAPVSSTAAAAGTVDIPFEKFQLANGLTVIVNEDHKASIVAVSIWYHIGSADEPPGKTGFAHLFEHLMFSGSEHHKGTYFAPFEKVGTTDMNGTTWFDRTNYFETVPTTALDMALWMESDRMGHLLGAIGQPELDAQRGVVQNEKRQGENKPYGRTDENFLKNAYPANHPYHHSAIGSMADLDAASLDDVKAWFRANYGAANTTLALSGDITPAIAREKVQRYFGDIPAGPPVPRQQAWIAARETSTRGTQSDHVAQVRIQRFWNVPPRGDADLPLLKLAATVLGGNKTSRLYQRLVYRDMLVDDIDVGVEDQALASVFELDATVKNGVDPAKVEAAVVEEWTTFLKDGPSEDELARAKTGIRARFIRGLESDAGKASILAASQVYLGDPGAYKKDLERTAAATPASVLAAAKRWIAKGDYTLTVVPAKPGADLAAEDAAVKGLPAAAGKPAPVSPPTRAYTTATSTIDRSKGVPEVSRFPDLTFPAVQRATLKNGMSVVLAERHTIPVTNLDLQFDAGFAADQGHQSGTAKFTAAMLSEGTQTLDSVEIAKRSQRYGASIGSSAALDESSVSLSALNSDLPAAIALYADVVRHPAFHDADIERVRAQWLAGIEQEKTTPNGMALRILPPLLYGKQHAYGIPLAGNGTEASIKALTAADLAAFHRDIYRPDNATLFVVGDTTLDNILPLLERAFGDWRAPASALPKKNLATVGAQSKPRVFLVNRPDSPQSLVLAGTLAPPTRAPGYFPSQTANAVFGGTFTSRINMNLREDKHWAYGAGSSLSDAIGQRPLFISASVQTDKTAESIAAALEEVRAIGADKPPTEAEIEKIKETRVRALPGQFETASIVLGQLAANQLYGRPDDYVRKLKSNLEAQTPAQVDAAAKSLFVPEALTWVIVGDLSKIEQPVRALNLGEVKVIDADGNTVR